MILVLRETRVLSSSEITLLGKHKGIPRAWQIWRTRRALPSHWKKCIFYEIILNSVCLQVYPVSSMALWVLKWQWSVLSRLQTTARLLNGPGTNMMAQRSSRYLWWRRMIQLWIQMWHHWTSQKEKLGVLSRLAPWPCEACNWTTVVFMNVNWTLELILSCDISNWPWMVSFWWEL